MEWQGVEGGVDAVWGWKRELVGVIDALKDELWALSAQIHAHPELGFNEHKACAWLTEAFERHGYRVQKPVGSLETSFRAQLPLNGWSNPSDGPTIAVLCEYDALPGLGHACGHNVIASAGAGAAIGLAEFFKREESTLTKRLPAVKANLIVIGTPAEEGGGGKVLLLKDGVFEGVDAAMMIHPWFDHNSYRPLLGIKRIKFVYRGKSSHAATTPWEGVNALDGVIQLFNNVALMRQQLRPDSRVHGIITKGGDAVNIIPEHCEALMNVRSPDIDYLPIVYEKVINCAKAAALSTGCTVEISPSGPDYLPMKDVDLYSDAYATNYQWLLNKGSEQNGSVTITKVRSYEGSASSDIGNVSQVIPTIHPYVGITNKDYIPPHTREFESNAGGELGREGTLLGAKGLAMTALDLLFHPTLLRDIKEAFHQRS